MNARVMNGLSGIALTILLVWGLVPGDALAAGDGFQFTRAHYDQIMRYFNFLILAGVAIKFGRKPIVSFLRGQKNEVAETIKQLEARKREAEERINQSQEQLAHSQERLAMISDRIQAEGLQRKQEIIDQAQNECKIMMESAQMKVQNFLREAVQGLKIEILDDATEKAIEKLPSVLMKEDHERLLNQLLEAVEDRLSLA